MSSSTLLPSEEPTSEKRCTKCGQTKPVGQFRVVRRRGREERHSWCADCLRDYQREQYAKHRPKRRAYSKRWREANADKVRAKQRDADRRWREGHGRDTVRETHLSWVRRLARQGLTPEDYDRILAEQGGGCAICKTKDPGKAGRGVPGKFPADHCHKTGASRGLLCHRCNRGLGMFDDDPEILRAAAAYLER
jgi:hypothetical protein